MSVLNRTMRAATSALLSTGWLPSMLAMNTHAKGFYTAEFLGAGLSSGVLAALEPRGGSVDELAARLGVGPGMVSGLAAWLDLGVSLALLDRRGEVYRLRRRTRVLLREENDPIAAYYVELTHLHHRLVAETPARLREGRPFALGDADPALIARSSRFAEPYIAAALATLTPTTGPARLLEVGCGSGAHIRAAADLNPQLTALGIELQADAAAQARGNIEEWGLADRVTVEVGDIRDRVGGGDADLLTLHQNVYYFPVAERVGLLRHLATFLRPGGTLLVTSICRSGAHTAAALDLWGAMTAGADRLPVRDELAAQLTEAGYVDVRAEPVTPDGMFCAFVGIAPGA